MCWQLEICGQPTLPSERDCGRQKPCLVFALCQRQTNRAIAPRSQRSSQQARTQFRRAAVVCIEQDQDGLLRLPRERCLLDSPVNAASSTAASIPLACTSMLREARFPVDT